MRREQGWRRRGRRAGLTPASGFSLRMAAQVKANRRLSQPSGALCVQPGFRCGAPGPLAPLASLGGGRWR
eukprot:7378789-Alexandrium_andersonii.AAC.1